jgi:ornithine cyclodeaminase/alanine dehydrogenase-like protein (mu-crystallin family)
MIKLEDLHGSSLLSAKETIEILENVGWKEIVERVRETFIEEANSRTKSPSKIVMGIEKYNNDFRVMPSYMEKYPQYCGCKIVCACPDNPSKFNLPTVTGTYILHDAEKQIPILICDAGPLTAYRTAAATAVAVDELSNKEAKTLGIIGCGHQAYYHLNAIMSIRNIEKVYVSDINRKNEANLLNHFRPFPFTAKTMVASNKKEMFEKCDIIITLTPTKEPFIFAEDIPNREMCLCSVGGDNSEKIEVDPNVYLQTEFYCDSQEQASHTGFVIKGMEEKLINPYDLVPIGERMEFNRRSGGDRVKMFLSTGVALEDLAMAILINERKDT